MKVRDIMTGEVACCRLDTNLAAAAGLMWVRDCGVLPVVEDGRLFGIITDRDICIALGTKNRGATEVTVGEVCTRDVHVCGADDDIDSAMAQMRRAKVRRLPVVTAGQVAGLLALNDVAAAADVRSTLSASEVIDTLKAVGERRVPRTTGMPVEPKTWPPIPVAVA